MIDDANALVVEINGECNIPKTGLLSAAPTEGNVQCSKTRFERQRNELISRLLARQVAARPEIESGGQISGPCARALSASRRCGAPCARPTGMRQPACRVS